MKSIKMFVQIISVSFFVNCFYKKLRRYEDVIQYCEQIPDSDGKDYISKQWRLNIIAKSYFYLGKLDEALEVIKRNEQAAVDSEWY